MCMGQVLGWGEGEGQGHSSHIGEHVQKACCGESMGIQGTEIRPEWLGRGDAREWCEAGIMQVLSRGHSGSLTCSPRVTEVSEGR